MMSLHPFLTVDQLPMDNIDVGFDNNADNLHLSRVDMESYFKVANRIAESVVSDKLLHVKRSSTPLKTPTSIHIATRTTLMGLRRRWPLRHDLWFLHLSSSNKTIHRSNEGIYRVVPRVPIRAKFVPGNRFQERLPVTEINEVDTNDTLKPIIQ